MVDTYHPAFSRCTHVGVACVRYTQACAHLHAEATRLPRPGAARLRSHRGCTHIREGRSGAALSMHGPRCMHACTLQTPDHNHTNERDVSACGIGFDARRRVSSSARPVDARVGTSTNVTAKVGRVKKRGCGQPFVGVHCAAAAREGGVLPVGGSGRVSRGLRWQGTVF